MIQSRKVLYFMLIPPESFYNTNPVHTHPSLSPYSVKKVKPGNKLHQFV